MFEQNFYLAYKQDLRHLLYWLLHIHNSTINLLNNSQVSPSLPLPPLNDTGQIALSALVPLAFFIRQYGNDEISIPWTIFRLFQSVIAARSRAHAVFNQILAKSRDPDLRKVYDCQDDLVVAVLTRAFEILGGPIRVNLREHNITNEVEEDYDEMIFGPQYTSPSKDRSGDAEEGISNAGEEAEGRTPKGGSKRAKIRNAGKGKTQKRRDKGKGKERQVEEDVLDHVPLKSYRITEGVSVQGRKSKGGNNEEESAEGASTEDGSVEIERMMEIDYLMAIHSLLSQCSDLRNFVQGQWRQVAYGGMNSAIAGAVSNIAVARIKEVESEICAEFPGRGSFNAMMSSITAGDGRKVAGMFTMTFYPHILDGGIGGPAVRHSICHTEQLMVHTYYHLMEFLRQFQLSRSHKIEPEPTPRYSTEFRKWNSKVDFRELSNSESIHWTGVYTIGWLYDLVHYFLKYVLQNTQAEQSEKLAKGYWTQTSSWKHQRRLYALADFAGEITQLAYSMGEPCNEDEGPKMISLSLVFELTCAVESFLVSRGFSRWLQTEPAYGFEPMRDVDIFLDREDKRFSRGLYSGIELLSEMFQRDLILHAKDDPGRHRLMAKLLST